MDNILESIDFYKIDSTTKRNEPEYIRVNLIDHELDIFKDLITRYNKNKFTIKSNLSYDKVVCLNRTCEVTISIGNKLIELTILKKRFGRIQLNCKLNKQSEVLDLKTLYSLRDLYGKKVDNHEYIIQIFKDVLIHIKDNIDKEIMYFIINYK